MKTSVSSFSLSKNGSKIPQFSRSWTKQEATVVGFSQIYNQSKTEVIMIETAGRQCVWGEWCHPDILLPPKLLSFMNEMCTLPILTIDH